MTFNLENISLVTCIAVIDHYELPNIPHQSPNIFLPSNFISYGSDDSVITKFSVYPVGVWEGVTSLQHIFGISMLNPR